MQSGVYSTFVYAENQAKTLIQLILKKKKHFSTKKIS
jgi:hypothetical protein